MSTFTQNKTFISACVGTALKLVLAYLAVTLVWSVMSGQACAQVPTRVQSGQIVIPQATAPPEQPIQRELKSFKEDVKTKTQAIERKIGITFPKTQREGESFATTRGPSSPSDLRREIGKLERQIAALQRRLDVLRAQLQQQGGKP
jgi:hypothetical protein